MEIIVLLRLELGQYLVPGSNLTENDNAQRLMTFENSTQSKSGGKEHSGQNQHQFLQNYKYRRKKVLSSRLNRIFDEAGTALSISKLNSATSKSKAETEKATELMEQMGTDHLDIPTTVDIVQQ